jgi:hypothetical protein
MDAAGAVAGARVDRFSIGYYGDLACSEMSPGMMVPVNFGRTVVIVEETAGDPGGRSPECGSSAESRCKFAPAMG